MTCSEILYASQLILLLARHDRLPQVILRADRAFVEMHLKAFHLPWKVTRDEFGFVTVTRTARGTDSGENSP